MTTDNTIQRSTSLPPRPTGNGWASRLWDNMYGTEEEIPRKNKLQLDVENLLKQGESLRSLLNTVNTVLGQNNQTISSNASSSPKPEIVEVNETNSLEETKQESEDIFYSASDILIASTRASVSETSQRKNTKSISHRVMDFILRVSAAKKVEAQNKKRHSRKVQSHRKKEAPLQQKKHPASTHPTWMSIANVF